jgi:hypothetical protein
MELAVNGPFDAQDEAILGDVRDLYNAVDPVPSELVPRIRFAISLEDLDVEMMQLAGEVPSPAAATRGSSLDHEIRRITFDCAALTIMISVAVVDDDTVHIDGWLAPPGPHRVELRTVRGSLATTADNQGRFAVNGVARGLAQLVVRTAAGPDAAGGGSVITPSIVV